MSSGTFPLALRATASAGPRLGRLNATRAGVVVGQTLLLVLAHEYPGTPMPLLLLAFGVAAAAAASTLALLDLRRHSSLDDAAFFRHILVDLAVLTYVLSIAGGPANPFHDAYFIPVAVAAASLAARYAWAVAAASMGCYTIAQFVYIPLPGAPNDLEAALGAGEWITHAALAALATYFLLRITRNLRERERELSEERESAARAEFAIAIGSVAAGAAHELSTPLSTITATLDELRAEHGDRAELRKSLDTLAGGIAECRKALQVLRQLKGPQGAPQAQWVGLRELFEHILERFHNMRPTVKVAAEIGPGRDEPTILADVALQQAVINLLSNAAQVSPEHVALAVAWNADELRITVTDHGPGIPPEVTQQLGRTFVSTKPGGYGLGLFLTRVTAQRLGGRFQIQDANQRGAVAELVLPLATLQPRR